MSQNKRQQWEALTAVGDAGELDSVADLLDPEMEFRSVFSVAEGQGVYAGIDGLQRWLEDVHATWDDWLSEVVDFREAGGDQAVAVHRVTGRAKGSGVPLDAHLGLVLTWRHGRLWRAVSYRDPREALEAVGLRE